MDRRELFDLCPQCGHGFEQGCAATNHCRHGIGIDSTGKGVAEWGDVIDAQRVAVQLHRP